MPKYYVLDSEFGIRDEVDLHEVSEHMRERMMRRLYLWAEEFYSM
jgi:hypothetical protein